MTTGARYDIGTLLDDVITLPSLPVAVDRIIEMTNDPECPLPAIAKSISVDPSLTLKVLRLVNSAHHALGQQVTSVERAVVLLGPKVIRNLVFTATVFEALGKSTQSFLRHCVACGVAMRVLALNGRFQDLLGSPDDAFVYGLLHDIGKVMLTEFLPDLYQTVTECAAHERRPLYRVELEIIGVDHAVLGGRLAEKWRLPPPIVNAISGHHNLDACDPYYRGLAAMLCVIEYICSASGFPPHPHAVHEIPESAWETAGMEGYSLMEYLDDFFESTPAIEELMRLSK